MKRRTIESVKISESDLKKISESFNLSVPHLKAILAVESNGKGFWEVPGYLDIVPVVRFEKHIFTRITNGRYSKEHPHLVGRVWQDSPSGYKAWALLSSALKVDRNAAVQSASWGLMQIMGFHFRACGCKDIESFVKLMSKSEAEQLKLGLTYMRTFGLIEVLQSNNWKEFARRYNGSLYWMHGYDKKLKRAYDAARSTEEAKGEF